MRPDANRNRRDSTTNTRGRGAAAMLQPRCAAMLVCSICKNLRERQRQSAEHARKLAPTVARHPPTTATIPALPRHHQARSAPRVIGKCDTCYPLFVNTCHQARFETCNARHGDGLCAIDTRARGAGASSEAGGCDVGRGPALARHFWVHGIRRQTAG